MELEKLFCDVDDFCKDFEKKWQQELLSTPERKRQKTFYLCLSEVMTTHCPLKKGGTLKPLD